MVSILIIFFQTYLSFSSLDVTKRKKIIYLYHFFSDNYLSQDYANEKYFIFIIFLKIDNKNFSRKII